MKTIATALATLGLLLTACSSSSTSGGSTTAAGESTTTASADTTPETTADTTTTSTSTTVPEAIVFDLHGGGIGPFTFGTSVTELVDALTAAFGAPTADESRDYPADDGFGGFQDAAGEFGFVAQAGRTICWAFEFCAEFGGADAASLTFVGWTYGENPGATLASTEGVTNGMRASDSADIFVSPGGCYNVGYGGVGGIQLTLLSENVEFSGFDDDGNYFEATPPLEEITVIYMQAGDIPIFLFGDC